MRKPLGVVVRAVVMLCIGLLAVWSLPKGGQLLFSGVVLALTVALGFIAKQERLLWYLAGTGLIVACLFLGVVDGPLDDRITGYCDSVFEPGYTQADDAPPGTYERCDEARRERIPIVAGLGLLGLAALGTSLIPLRRHREVENVVT